MPIPSYLRNTKTEHPFYGVFSVLSICGERVNCFTRVWELKVGAMRDERWRNRAARRGYDRGGGSRREAQTIPGPAIPKQNTPPNGCFVLSICGERVNPGRAGCFTRVWELKSGAVPSLSREASSGRSHTIFLEHSEQKY